MNYTEEELQARMLEVIERGARMRGWSIAERVAALGISLEDLEATAWRHLRHDWLFWARPKQLLVATPELPGWYPGPRKRWRLALYLAGRGSGKTRTGAETTWYRIERGHARSTCLIGPTWSDVKRTMVGGKPDTEAGLLDVVPPHVEHRYNRNNAEIYFPAYGATVYLATGEEADQRGGNYDFVWLDEPIKFRRLAYTLNNLLLALRKPTGSVQALLTSTPKRQQWLRDMVMDPSVLVIHGVTGENAANLHPDFLADMRQRYGGTRIGRQELEAQILGDAEGALTTTIAIERLRVDDPPELVEVGVGIDPAVSTRRRSDDSGIVAAGRGVDGHLYVLEDRTGRYRAEAWPREAVALARDWGAKFLIIEENKIGDTGVALLRHALEAAKLSDRIEIRGAYSFKDKWTRSQPVAALYDQGRVHHVGRHPTLETELTQWEPTPTNRSPNSLDAFVHVGIELLELAKSEPTKDPSAAFRGLRRANEGFESVGWGGSRAF